MAKGACTCVLLQIKVAINVWCYLSMHEFKGYATYMLYMGRNMQMKC